MEAVVSLCFCFGTKWTYDKRAVQCTFVWSWWWSEVANRCTSKYHLSSVQPKAHFQDMQKKTGFVLRHDDQNTNIRWVITDSEETGTALLDMSRGYDEGNSLAMILTPTLQLCRWNYQAASSSLVPRQTVVDQNSADVKGEGSRVTWDLIKRVRGCFLFNTYTTAFWCSEYYVYRERMLSFGNGSQYSYIHIKATSSVLFWLLMFINIACKNFEGLCQQFVISLRGLPHGKKLNAALNLPVKKMKWSEWSVPII